VTRNFIDELHFLSVKQQVDDKNLPHGAVMQIRDNFVKHPSIRLQ
jgi:hypothetical protein